MSSNSAKDDVLESFVQAANQDDFSLDITLMINGAIVTGTLISASEYFETQSKYFKGGNKRSKEFSEDLAGASEAAESSDGEANYIHLKDVSIFLGDSKPTPSSGKITWRGNLSAVDSFFLGKIKTS
ncbi:gas vesicle accessory protein GvpU [Staphylococcus simulans]|uniref:gas vesicle accessory protein GvpU n=1 Tax=Staphylococcus simulans TaxID=1286 RepID=UPI003F80A54A